MKTKILLALVSSLIIHHSAFSQGALTPPGAPAPTMRTLDQLDAKLEKRTPISSLPFAIMNSGSYYLTTNLTQSGSADGISIQADNVSLDLNGFSLISGGEGGTAIINPSSHFNLHIHNGKILGWNGGSIALNSATTEAALENLQCHGLQSSAATNVILGGQSRISRCQITRINGLALMTANRCHIEDCQCVLNGGGGMIVGDECQIVNSIVKQNIGGWGIKTGNNCIIRGNIISGNASGVSVRTACTITENQIENNNFGAGQSGLLLNDRFNRVENNVILFNGSFGITSISGATNNLIIRNFVASHSSTNFGFVGAQILGPIVSTVGDITNSNPWANFSF